MLKNINNEQWIESITINTENYTEEEVAIIRRIFGIEEETKEIFIKEYNIDYEV